MQTENGKQGSLITAKEDDQSTVTHEGPDGPNETAQTSLTAHRVNRARRLVKSGSYRSRWSNAISAVLSTSGIVDDDDDASSSDDTDNPPPLTSLHQVRLF